MSEQKQYEWTAEEREVPALRKIMKTGDAFSAASELGDHLVAQGVAKPAGLAALASKLHDFADAASHVAKNLSDAMKSARKASGDPAED